MYSNVNTRVKKNNVMQQSLETFKACSRKTDNTKSRITLLCDSQGRDLSSHLDIYKPSNCNIFNYVQPGASLETVFNSAISISDFKSYSKSDHVVIIGGTNNVSKQKNNPYFFNYFTQYLSKKAQQFEHTNLILSTIPYRYDLREDSKENQCIKEINNYVRKLVNSHSYMQLLDLHLLERHCHTLHGLHINRRGKKFVSKEIIKLIKNGTSHPSFNERMVPAGNTLANNNVPAYEAPLPAVIEQSASDISLLCDLSQASPMVGFFPLGVEATSMPNSITSHSPTALDSTNNSLALDSTIYGFSTPDSRKLDYVKNLLKTRSELKT